MNRLLDWIQLDGETLCVVVQRHEGICYMDYMYLSLRWHTDISQWLDNQLLYIHTYRQTGRWMDKQSDRQMDGQTVRQTDGRTDRQMDKQTVRQKDGQTVRQTDEWLDRQTDRHTDGWTDGQTDRQTDGVLVPTTWLWWSRA